MELENNQTKEDLIQSPHFKDFYLMNNLDLEKYEIVATGTKKEYPYDFYKGAYYQVNITNKNDFDKVKKIIGL